MNVAPATSGIEVPRQRLNEDLRARGLDVAVRANRNRGLILGLRGDPRTGLRLSVHEALLGRPEALPLIADWVAGRGRQLAPALRALLDEVQSARRLTQRRDATSLHLPALGMAPDPQAVLRRIHGTWFPHLTLPDLVLARRSHRARQRRIHFATYHRPSATIRLHPRMLEPWVAAQFLDYVMFHELCHHAQSAAPQRGETPHSRRFRLWEARFPGLDQVLRWERDHLARFLGD